MNLDLRKFTKNLDVPDEYYKYELCGAVIHKGTITNGHYWSWVKQGNFWIKANDSTIETYSDHQGVIAEGFGGENERIAGQDEDVR